MSDIDTLPEVTFILPFDEVCASETSIQIKLKIKRARNMTYEDSVGLFPYHWSGPSDGICSITVPRPRPRDEVELELTFNIPKTEVQSSFQFIYITGDDRIAGTSRRFKIVHKTYEDIRKLRNILGSFTAKQVQLETRRVERESQVERLQNLAGKLLKDLKDVKEKKRREVTDLEERNELLRNSLKEREELMKTITEQITRLEKANMFLENDVECQRLKVKELQDIYTPLRDSMEKEASRRLWKLILLAVIIAIVIVIVGFTISL